MLNKEIYNQSGQENKPNYVNRFAEGWLEKPKVIDTPYPFFVNGDLNCVAKRVIPNLNGEIENIQNDLYTILESNMPENSTFYTTSADYLNSMVEQRLKPEIENPSKRVGVINLDRYLCSNINSDSIFKINLSRNIDGGLVARPGEKSSPTDQIQKLVEWLKIGKFQELILVDDVLAFGETLVPLINELRSKIQDVNIRVLVGIASSGGDWSGIEKVKNETGVTPEFAVLIKASPKNKLSSGMAIPTSRDFTFFGGKISQTQEKPISFPYFLPFSIPVASFMPQEKQVDSARRLLKLNSKLAGSLGNIFGRDLKISDLTKSGFGVPYTKIKCLAQIMRFPDSETSVYDYLKYSGSILESNMDRILKETLGN